MFKGFSTTLLPSRPDLLLSQEVVACRVLLHPISDRLLPGLQPPCKPAHCLLEGSSPRAAPATWKSVQSLFWPTDKAQCSCIAGLHTSSLYISKEQSCTERETFVLSSYSLTFPRLSVSTKAGHTGLMSKGCSDVHV